MRRIRSVAVRDHYEIVHAHQRAVSTAARVVLAGSGIPLVEHVHNVFRPNRFSKLVSFRGDRLIACGSRIATMLEQDFHRAPNRIRTVLNAVPDVGDRGGMVVRAVGTSAPVKLISVARLSPQKDPLRALDVIELLDRRQQGEWHLTWVGGGELADEFEEAIRHRGLPVSWIGERDDVPRLLAEADGLLLTSRWEGLPLVLLEAMRGGLACVAPDVGSCSDAVENGATGFLYSVESSASEIADTLELARSDLDRLGDAARRRYEASFTEERLLREIFDVYEELIRC